MYTDFQCYSILLMFFNTESNNILHRCFCNFQLCFKSLFIPSPYQYLLFHAYDAFMILHSVKYYKMNTFQQMNILCSLYVDSICHYSFTFCLSLTFLFTVNYNLVASFLRYICISHYRVS